MSETGRISRYLDEGEEVLAMATQARHVPGGSPVTPGTIFATDRKVIIRNPLLLGLREKVEYFRYRDIMNVAIERGYFSSSLRITAPGMGTVARPAQDDGRADGSLGGLDTAGAMEIMGIIEARARRG